MSKKMYEKVAVCNIKGELILSKSLIKDLFNEYDLQQIWTNSYSEFVDGLLYAKQCSHSGDEREAVSIYWMLYFGLRRNTTISEEERRSLIEEIYRGFSYLYDSKDDYVWEESSEFISIYQNLLTLPAK